MTFGDPKAFETKPIYTPVKGAHGWVFKQAWPIIQVTPKNSPGVSQGTPYACCPDIGGLVTAKTAEEAITILALLNTGLVYGTWRIKSIEGEDAK